jgi:hypothetical protein
MTYYKCLVAGSASPFSGFRWEEPGVRAIGNWVHTDRDVDPCRSGIHACRLEDLPLWLQPELWTIELAGDVIETPLKVVAATARLLQRVDAWDEAAGGAYALACARRAGEFAADELAVLGLEGEADTVRQRLPRPEESDASDWYVPEAARDRSGPVVDALGDGGRAAVARCSRAVQRSCGYAIDAFTWLPSYTPTAIAAVATRARQARASVGEPDPAAAERSWQAGWLAQRLGLQE